MQKNFSDFYTNIGFKKYPFRDKTSEKEDSDKLFIAPINYSLLEDVFENKQTAVINGDRGTGKTIMLKDLKSKSLSDKLLCLIDNFEDIPLTNNLTSFYSLILQNIVNEMLIYLALNKKTLKNLSSDDKILLSLLIKKYGETFTEKQLHEKIEKIQLNWFKRLINKFSPSITSFFNFGATAATNFGNELLTKYFGPYLPLINEGSIKKIVPDIKFNVENEFKSIEVSYSLLDKSLALAKKVSNAPAIVLIDKLDEDIRLENDAELISEFIKDLLCDNNLLLNSNIQLIVSVWKIPFKVLTPNFRRSKHFVYDIDWNPEHLEAVLNQRINHYSDSSLTDYHTLFDSIISQDDIDIIFELSNSNPRDLWGIFDCIYNEQHKLDSNTTKITSQALNNGLKSFVKTFAFYEYYPKKKNARKNTNDIYSYIQHLLKLNNDTEFTNDELRIAANTGGSTTNYITGMLNIGLISKTEKKRDGGSVIYEIIDPKVKYAIKNKLEITHA